MWIYIITFIISFSFVLIGNNQRKKNIRWIFFILAILFPSLLAGFRDDTVGHDVLAYVTPCFNNILEINDWELLVPYIILSDLEVFYIIFNFIITRFTDDIFWLYFAQQSIALFLVLLTCEKLKHEINGPVVYLLYLLFFYCISLCIVRQAFAVSIIFFSFYYILNNKRIKFLLCAIIAMLFHNSAVFAIVIFFLYQYAINQKRPISFMKQSLLITIGFSFVLLFPVIISFLLDIGLINSKFERYIDTEDRVHIIDLVITLILYLFTIFAPKMYAHNNVLKIFVIVTSFLILCGQYNDVATRVTIYFTLFIIVNIARLATYSCHRKPILVGLVLLFLVRFLYLGYMSGIAETIPYTSKRIGIYAF